MSEKESKDATWGELFGFLTAALFMAAFAGLLIGVVIFVVRLFL